MQYVILFLEAQIITLLIFLILCMVGSAGDDDNE